MRHAIFSDIHNHLQALKAVLHHTDQQQIDRYFCLGDIGDLGKNTCVTIIREMDIATVFGNWEAFVWHHYTLENQQWILNLPPILKQDNFWLTHAAPLWPPDIQTLEDLDPQYFWDTRAQLFPYLHYESAYLWQSFKKLNDAQVPLLFHGHTHIQMGWRKCNDQIEQVREPVITLTDNELVIIGVGSVGEPKDSSNPAYVIYDDETKTVEMVKV